MTDRSVSVPVTSDADFKVTFFEVEYLKKRTKLLYHNNRKTYLAYRMVPCLVTFTDLSRGFVSIS